MKTTTPDDTIAAIATPVGPGAIGIVRLSGPHAISIVASLFSSPNDRDPVTDRGRVFYGEIRDGDEHVDEVLVHIMRAPNTYTREDVVEINGHGGAVPLSAMLQLVLRKGARLAEPGEFSKRAFLNGRIDLAQAEAVMDRVQAQTMAGMRAAAETASGALSRALHSLTQRLRDVKARVEAAIDFPDQDVPELINDELRSSLEGVLDEMDDLLQSAHRGRLLREGVSITIAGKPNVGKSSLFNALVRDARAIVTPHEGTTRDLIEETISLGGIPARLIDTAGLRDTDSEVETLGIEAARKALASSAIILFIVDASEAVTEDDHALAVECLEYGVPTLLVANKADLKEPDLDAWRLGFEGKAMVSATTGFGLRELEETLSALISGASGKSANQALITRAHQQQSLERAHASTQRVLENFSASPEFLALDLDDALQALGEITGETTPDDVLERIFGAFCIGK